MQLIGYERVEQLGRGAYGEVFKAWQVDFQRWVAVKVLDPQVADPATVQRFERERRVLGALGSHPHVVTVLAAGTVEWAQNGEQRPYIVMPFLEGGDWVSVIAARGRLDVAEVLDVGIKLCGALATAHAADVIHRDIKPDNVLLDEFAQPLLADFGIARLEQAEGLTQIGHAPGTLVYMAPEALDNRVSAASDVYSLAATLHHALLGRPTFDRGLGAIAIEPPETLTAVGVHEVVDRVLRHAMEKDPGDRIATAVAFGEALQAAQTELGLGVTRLMVRGLDSAPHGRAGAPGTVPTPGSPAAPGTVAAPDTVAAPGTDGASETPWAAATAGTSAGASGQAHPDDPPPRQAGRAVDGPPLTPGHVTVPVPGLEAVEEARVRWMTGDVRGAREVLVELVDDPDPVVASRAAIELAQVDASGGDLQGALGLLLPQLDPTSPGRERAAVVVSQLRAAIGDTRGAFDVLHQVRTAPGPDRGVVLEELAELHMRLGQLDAATVALDEAAVMPGTTGHPALLLQAWIDLRVGRIDQARAVFTQLSFDADPETRGTALTGLAEASERRDPDAAVDLYRRVIDGDFPTEPRVAAAIGLGGLLDDLGQPHAAVEAYRIASETGHPTGAPLAAVLVVQSLVDDDPSAAEGWMARAEAAGAHPTATPVLAYGRALMAGAADDLDTVAQQAEMVFAAEATEYGSVLSISAANLVADIGDVERAQRVLTRIYERGSPANAPDAALCLAALQLASGQVDTAVEWLDAAATAGDLRVGATAQLELGRLKLADGDVQLGTRLLKRVVASGDQIAIPSAQLLLAEAQLARGRQTAAISELRRIADSPRADVAVEAMLVLADLGAAEEDPSEAYVWFDRAAQAAEGHRDLPVLVLTRKAGVAGACGDFDVARAALQQALGVAGGAQRDGLNLDLVDTYLAEGRDDIAGPALQQVIDSANDEHVADVASVWLGELEIRRGDDVHGLRRLVGIAESASPAALEAVVALGSRYAAIGRHDEARRWHRRAAELDPGDPEPQRRIGITYLEDGRPAEALGVLQAALDLGDHDEMLETLLLVGHAHRALGDEASAVSCWRRVIKGGHPDLAAAANDALRAGRR